MLQGIKGGFGRLFSWERQTRLLQGGAVAALAASFLVSNHYPPWQSVYNELVAGIALVLLTLAVVRTVVSERTPLAAWVVVGTASLPLAQWMLGKVQFASDALLSVLYLLVTGLSVAVGHAWARNGSRSVAAARLSCALLVAAIASSVIAGVQVVMPGNVGLWIVEVGTAGRAAANLAQPNNLATLLGLGAVGLLLLRETRRLPDALALVFSVILVLALAATQSRMAFLFGPIMLVGILVARRRGTSFRTSARTISLLTASHWLVAIGWPLLHTAMFDAGDSLAQKGLGTHRFQMWSMLLQAISLRPLGGFGWLQVGSAQIEAGVPKQSTGELWFHAHNLFLDLLIWNGVVIGGLLCALILCWYASRSSLVRTSEGLVGMIAISIFGAHAMVELPHHYLYFLIPVGLWIGIVESEVEGSKTSARLLAVPITGAAVLSVLLLKDYYAVEEDFRAVRFENQRLASPIGADKSVVAPVLSSLSEFLRFTRTVPASGMSAQTLEWMRTVAMRYPYPAVLLRYSSSLALNQLVPEAVGSFVLIRHIYGEETYRQMQDELRGRVQEGRPQLQVLVDALPD